MKSILLLLLLLGTFVVRAQRIVRNENELPDTNYHADLRVHFPGGDDAWFSYVVKRLDTFGALAQCDSLQECRDTIYFSFIVSAKGRPYAPRFTANANVAFRASIHKMLEQSPDWYPDIQGSGPVKSRVAYRIIYWRVADFAGAQVNRMWIIPKGL